MVVALCLGGVDLTALAADPPAENVLKVAHVVLFNSGVAYVEHRGTVRDDAEVTLPFVRQDMNDLLKSLTVIDSAGDQVSSIVYDSTKTSEQFSAPRLVLGNTAPLHQALTESLDCSGLP